MGGFCSVRLAVHEATGLRVAVKVVEKAKVMKVSAAIRCAVALWQSGDGGVQQVPSSGKQAHVSPSLATRQPSYPHLHKAHHHQADPADSCVQTKVHTQGA